MKKVDYYAVHEPWKMPKWLGAAIGGVFAVIVIGSAWIIVDLMKPAGAAAVAAAPVQPTAAPVAKAGPAVALAQPVAANEPADAPVARPSRHASKHAAHKKTTVARKSAPSISNAKAHQILAKHDSKANRKSKDDLDRLLGL